MFGDDRKQLRAQFLTVWRKMRDRTPLEPLEATIADVLQMHPEYDALFEKGDDLLDADLEPNPFLHLALHVAIREQVATDRPPGVKALHQQLLVKTGDPLQTEHAMIECLAHTLWEAGRSGSAPDEQAYLEGLRRLT